jgi:hypothetical protein
MLRVTFRVSVVDFDGEAVHCRVNVARTGGSARTHVLNKRDLILHVQNEFKYHITTVERNHNYNYNHSYATTITKTVITITTTQSQSP